jgi:CheY-like chemotaxis protein
MEECPNGRPTTGSVVLADDDPMILAAISEALSAEGYSVHMARDGLEALALVRAVKPDSVILDIMLPKLDGGRLCAAIKQDERLRHIPIIVFSALGRDDYRYFPQLAADAYVAKGRLPVAVQNLLTALQQCRETRPERVKGEVLGHEDFRSRRIVSELLQDRRHLVAILQILAPGALEVDCDCRIVWANPGACASFGKTEAALVGEPFASLAPAENRQRIQGLLMDLMRAEEPVQIVTPLVLDGKALSVRLAPIIEDGACTGLLVMLEGEALRT